MNIYAWLLVVLIAYLFGTYNGFKHGLARAFEMIFGVIDKSLEEDEEGADEI